VATFFGLSADFIKLKALALESGVRGEQYAQFFQHKNYVGADFENGSKLGCFGMREDSCTLHDNAPVVIKHKCASCQNALKTLTAFFIIILLLLR